MNTTTKMKYSVVETHICPKCGKQDNDTLCDQCRFCGSRIWIM